MSSEIFFDTTGRLRSGWRFAIFCVLFVAVVVVLTVIPAALSSLTTPAIVRLVAVLIVLVPALVVGWWCGKHLEGLPFRALGASFADSWLTHLILGMVTGAGTLGIAVGLAFLSGGLGFEFNSIERWSLASSLVSSFVFLAIAAASEEALFRGYPFQTFVRSNLAWLAISITSLSFAAAHILNPNPGLIPAVNTALAGVWFGVAYLRTRDLWFVWGLHLIWNWLLAAVFGIEVSGLTDLSPASILREVDSGPAWLTGGVYGIEGGVVTTIAIAVSTVLIWCLPWNVKSEGEVKSKK